MIYNVTPADNLDTYIGYLNPGDTLLLGDGTYNQGVDLTGKDGEALNLIYVKAQNDGQAIVQGQLWIENASYLEIEGIYFNNDGGSRPWACVVWFRDCSNIRLYRVTARDPIAVGGYFCTYKFYRNVSNVLLEDCAGYGKCRKSISVSGYNENCTNITVRRFFSYWTQCADTNPPAEIYALHVDFYDEPDNIAENVVAFLGPNPNYPVHGLYAAAANQKWYGCINVGGNSDAFYFSSPSGDLMEHCVAIECTGDGNRTNQNAQNSVLRNFTWINNGGGDDAGVWLVSTDPGENLNVNHCFFQGSSGDTGLDTDPSCDGYMVHAHNRFWGIDAGDMYGGETEPGGNESFLDPGWDTDKYGKGAYLMASRTALAGQGQNGADVGANVIYRYVDGVLTDEPLWPWPMEDRIMSEVGVSVTWAEHGGIWKTLEGVYEGVQTEVATFNLQVSASSDDAYEESDGTIELAPSMVQVLNENEWLGARFTNVTIPQGSTINKARLKIYIHNPSYDDLELDAYAEDIDNSPTFTGDQHNISNRALTTAKTNVSASSVQRGWYEITVTSAVQEVINRSGWSSGNALSIIFDGLANCNLRCRSWEYGDHSLAPKLDIDYTGVDVPISIIPTIMRAYRNRRVTS